MKKVFFPTLLILILAGCGKLEEPEFKKLDNFGLKKLSFSEAVVGFDARYYNPNNFSVAVKEAVLDVYINETFLGKFNQPLQVDVQNKAEFSIPLEGTVSIEKALGMNLQNLVGKEVMVEARGSVKLGKAGVFINKDIDYKGKHVLDSDLIKNPAGAGL